MRSGELVRIHTLLEFGLDEDEQLFAFPWSPDNPVPHLAVIRHDAGYQVFPSREMARSQREALRLIPLEGLFAGEEDVGRLLGAGKGVNEVRARHYWFPTAPRVGRSDGVTRHGHHFIAFADAHPVSWAWTAREHRRAAEASVETVPAYRRRGWATRVLAAWISDTQENGRLAMLSGDLDDPGIEALARRLGGEPFAESVRYP